MYTVNSFQKVNTLNFEIRNVLGIIQMETSVKWFFIMFLNPTSEHTYCPQQRSSLLENPGDKIP